MLEDKDLDIRIYFKNDCNHVCLLILDSIEPLFYTGNFIQRYVRVLHGIRQQTCPLE